MPPKNAVADFSAAQLSDFTYSIRRLCRAMCASGAKRVHTAIAAKQRVKVEKAPIGGSFFRCETHGSAVNGRANAHRRGVGADLEE